MRSTRIPRVRQHDATDCGAACLSSVARYYGVDLPLARIRQHAGTDRDGTSLTGMIRAAQQLGLEARGVRAPLEVLSSVPLPAIAHLRDPRGWTHFVVLYAVRGSRIVVMDPAGGEVRRIEVSEFGEQWTGVLLLLAPRRAQQPLLARRTSAIGRFWRFASPHRRVMTQAATGAVAYTMLGLATAVFVQKVIDFVIPAGDRALLDLLAIAMLMIVVAQIYIRLVKDTLVLRTGQKLDASLLQGYYEHLLALPQQFFDTMRVGEIVSRLNDAVKIRHFLNEVAIDLLVNGLVIVFSFLLMVTYSWRLALLVAVSIPLYGIVYLITNRLNRRDQRRTMEAAAELEAHVVESVSAIRTIRSLALRDHAALAAERRLVRLLRPVYDVGRTAILSGSAAELVTRVSTVALLWCGTVLVLRDALTPGELMSFYALSGHLTPPVLAVIAANRQVQDALVASDRLFDVLDLERERDIGVTSLGPRTFGEIRFRDVHFRYGSRPPLFRGLNLSIRPGQITAIVGESGSGKSTLAAMLQRVHLPETGRILYGDIDLRYVRLESLLRTVAVVPQEVVLFTGTVLANLTVGEREPDLQRVEQVLVMAGLREFEDELPLGLATPLGDRGYALSGGQRQRLAIARALYRGPEVLVLDEATSGLDAHSEAIVQASLRRFAIDGGTVVLITHRLTSALSADRIVVLQNGEVVEQGSHTTLMQEDGPYRRLWEVQTRGIGAVILPERTPETPGIQV